MTKRTLGGFEPLFKAAKMGGYKPPTAADVYRALNASDISDEEYNRRFPSRPEKYIVDSEGNVFKKAGHLLVLTLFPD